MPNTFLTADTHFGHALMAQGTNRPWDNVEEMNEALIANWNSVVKPQDMVYHLGDVVMNRRFLAPCMARLNGRKKLVKGNHDVFRLNEYSAWFEDILGTHTFNECILSHIPVHVNQLNRFKVNVHGHTHKARVPLTPGVADERYICVSVEQTDYTPVSYDTIRERVNAQR